MTDVNNIVRIVKLETNVEHIKEVVDETRVDLKNFILSADKKYATKSELKTLENRVKVDEDAQRTWFQRLTPTPTNIVIILLTIFNLILFYKQVRG